MQCGKLIFVALLVAMLLAVAFVPEAEAHHHHRRGHGLPALLTAGIIAKVLEHQHHGCHHHHDLRLIELLFVYLKFEQHKRIGPVPLYSKSSILRALHTWTQKLAFN
ncbi:hypothetical protein HNY73_021102 [Argiope bruennichi]|uniref:Secreted protein n=1 Tax=Argiope bruennichi TaxID=94029 RepID=A0A8T0EBQ4_ARGBR|nr:hypothetical protein HNY73_021102 [Argiope bruennichi]